MKALTRWIYIMCYNHGPKDDAVPSFWHTFVRTSEGSDAAYALGAKVAERELAQWKGQYINDYVVELEG